MRKSTTQKKSQKRLDNQKKRTSTITWRTTPEVKADLQRKAKACGMSVSNYIHSLVCGYEPKAAMTADQEHKLDALIEARRDRTNISNALKVLSKSDRTHLFGDEKFMYRWKTDIDKDRAAITDIINSFTKPNAI